jgi:hypothetical protein
VAYVGEEPSLGLVTFTTRRLTVILLLAQHTYQPVKLGLGHGHFIAFHSGKLLGKVLPGLPRYSIGQLMLKGPKMDLQSKLQTSLNKLIPSQRQQEGLYLGRYRGLRSHLTETVLYQQKL